MFHKELIANLMGYPGSFIVRHPTGDGVGWRWVLHEDLPVDDGSKALAEELLVLGPYAARMRDFIEEVMQAQHARKLTGMAAANGAAADPTAALPSEKIANLADKVYASALCEALDDCLRQYEADLDRLYADADEDFMSIPQIRAAVADWFDTLPAVNALIDEIERRPTQLLSLVDQAVRFAAAQQPHLKSILNTLNKVLLAHIASWVVWGVVPDQAGFFIETTKLRDPAVTGAPATTTATSTAAGGDASAGGGGAVGISALGPAAVPPVGTGVDAEAELVSLFQPSYIPTHLAVKILQVGKHARKLLSGVRDMQPLLPEDAFTLSSCIRSEEVVGNGRLNVSLLEDVISYTERIIGCELWSNVRADVRGCLVGVGDYLLTFRGDLWRSFAVAALDVMGKFGVHVATSRDRSVVDHRQATRVREALSQAFHKAVLLHGNTNTVRTNASMATGVDTVAETLKGGKNGSAIDFYQLLSFSVAGDETALHKLQEPSAPGDRMSPSMKFANYILSTTKQMKLTFTPPVSVEGVFDPFCIELLQNTFSHCLYLLHTEVLLGAVWRSCITATKRLEVERRHRNTFRPANDDKIARGAQLLKPLMLLRRRMSHFIDNLKIYIMTDVVHAKFSALLNDLQTEVTTFEKARTSLKTCLQEISKDAFLVDPDKSNHLVLVTIRQAVKACIQVWYITYICFEQPGRSEDVFRAVGVFSEYKQTLEELSAYFDKHVTALYDVLSSNVQVNKYRQLLTRLNFNKYYSRHE